MSFIGGGGGGGEKIETLEFMPRPEFWNGANGTRAAQTNFDGATFRLFRRVTFNRIQFRLTAQSGGPTMRLLIYQRAGGGMGEATLKASVTGIAIGASGNFEVTPSEGTVTLEAGLIHVLWGKESVTGSFTAQGAASGSHNTVNANMGTSTHPIQYTTTIAANTSPATFNPITEPTAAAIDSALVLRLRKV